MSTKSKQSYTYDVDLALCDDGATMKVNTSPLQVDGAAAVIELGEGRLTGVLVVNALEVEIASDDEKYVITPVYGKNAGFSGDVVTGPALALGKATIPGTVNALEGRYEIPMGNVFNGESYGFMKLALTVSGTIATGIKMNAYLGRKTRI